MLDLTKKRNFWMLGIIPFALIGVALIMQYQFSLEPCPLCLVQRGIFSVIGVLYLFHALFSPRETGSVSILSLAIIFSLLGIVVAGRHVWIQHYPPTDLPGCLPSLSYLIEALPFYDAVSQILKGSADCRDVKWRFLGLSIPEQTLIIFAVYFLISSLFLFSFLKRGYAVHRVPKKYDGCPNQY